MQDHTENSVPPPDPEPVWTFRGYKMRPGEFNTAMVHFYRGEISRANAWRLRLDATTNWAVVTTAGVLTFTFGSWGNSHVIIVATMLLLWLFLLTEARRYRYYELWALRVRLMETDFFAAMLNPPFQPHPEWANRIADSLLNPEFPISHLEAIGRRLRRNYIWLFMVLAGAWVFKVIIHPVPAYSPPQFFKNASLGFVQGEVVFAVVVLIMLVNLGVAISTVKLQDSPGEVLPQVEALNIPGEFLQQLASAAGHLAEDLPFTSRHEQLAIIITEQAEAVSKQLQTTLSAGVTALEGRGMYSGAPRSVLLCAVPPKDTKRLKVAVYNIDPKAFVVVNPTEEVLGGAFGELGPQWRRGTAKRKK